MQNKENKFGFPSKRKIEFELNIKIILICATVILSLFTCKSSKSKSPIISSTRTIINHSDSAFIANAIESLDTANLPLITVQVNIHFVGNRNGNFYPGKASDEKYTNGLFWSEKLIGHANHVWRSLEASSTSRKNYLGNARLQFKIYTESQNTEDKYQGVWFWDNMNQVKRYYQEKVLNIILHDTGRPKSEQLSGIACGLNMCNELSLNGAYDNAANGGKFGWWSFAGTLNHEFGHICGLCHAFYCDNECKDIDLDAAKECHTAPCFNDCGGPNSGVCKCWDTGTKNMMGYNASGTALTPCQWKIMMRNLCFSKAEYIIKNFRSPKN
ncbi:MAG: hypothetical protein IPL98_02090 [Saprospiraceae bacterium]|nr:hypothetical protein [Saprospiraceae bacterium]